jgi:hypothetical protein
MDSNEEYLEDYIKENYIVYDRFTFDYLFRKLLKDGYDHEEAKDIIIHNCALSTIIFQERIFNEYYLNISKDENISKDLIEIISEIAERVITLNDKECERFYDYLSNKIMDQYNDFKNSKKLDIENKSLSNTNILYDDKAHKERAGKIQTIYGQLQQALGVMVEHAPDKWDRGYNVDFYIKVKDKYIGLQIKPAGYAYTTQIINELKFQKGTHDKFTAKYGGKVFYIISVKDGKKKAIHNPEVIEEIRKEIQRLQNE